MKEESVTVLKKFAKKIHWITLGKFKNSGGLKELSYKNALQWSVSISTFEIAHFLVTDDYFE